MAKSKEQPSKLSFIQELEQWKSLFLQHQSNEQKSRNTLALDERERLKLSLSFAEVRKK